MNQSIHKIILASITIVLGLTVIAASGCDGDDSSTNTSTASTGTVSTTAKTAGSQTQTTDAASSPAIPENTDSQSGSSPGSSSGYDTQDVNPVPVQIMSQIASPGTVSPGGSITIFCTVQGNAGNAWVEISKKMDSSFTPVSYPMTKGATGGNTTIWHATISAPSVAGLFAFSTYATDAGGTTVKNQLGQGPYDGPEVYFQVQ